MESKYKNIVKLNTIKVLNMVWDIIILEYVSHKLIGFQKKDLISNNTKEEIRQNIDFSY